MNKSLYTIVAAIIGVAGAINAADQGEGHKRLAAHIAAAQKTKKQGMAASAATGAQYGATGGVLTLGYQKLSSPYDYNYNLTLSNLVGYLVIGAGLGAVAGMWSDAFNTSSPAWLAQMDKLEKNKESIDKDEVFLTGVPRDQVSRDHEENVKKNFVFEMWWTGALKRVRKAYLLSQAFHDTTKAYDNDHYEIYLMPKDEALVSVFLAVNNELKKHNQKVAFLAMRPTPGLTKSPYDSKIMPRIILGFKDDATKNDVIKVLKPLYAMLKQDFPVAMMQNVTPRYSRQIGSTPIFHAYGSADFKDSAEWRKLYQKPVSRWNILNWFAAKPSDHAMAYSAEDKALQLKQSDEGLIE